MGASKNLYMDMVWDAMNIRLPEPTKQVSTVTKVKPTTNKKRNEKST